MTSCKLYKTLLCFYLILFLSFLSSCGYQSLLNENSKKFGIKSFNIEGNKRLAQILKNNLVSSKNKSNNLILDINARKNRSIAHKDLSGKIIEYNLKISFDLIATESVSRKKILSKTFTLNSNYKASDLYSNTLNHEKKIINQLTEAIAAQILIDLSLAYGEK
jgi:outer membrane lipopolysaccharide assembly protein LptE/RlpB